jgi:hypothetical protein
MPKQFIFTKRIAKMGRQSIIIIPKLLSDTEIKPKMVVKVTLDILEMG